MFVGRGVVQISGYIDAVIASLLGTGALARAHECAGALHAAGEPVRHERVGGGAARDVERGRRHARRSRSICASRLDGGLRRIAFFVIPSAMAFLALGDVLAGALFKSGRFTQADSVYVWSILAGSAVGLLASTLGRLYASTYYALRDTRTPLRYAIVRVVLTSGLGYLFAIPAAEAARHRCALGRGGAHGVRGHRGLGGVRAAAPHAQRAHRPHGPSGVARRAALARRRRRRGCRVGSEGARRSSLRRFCSR